MAAPLKPWEKAGVVNQMNETVFNNGMSGYVHTVTYYYVQ